MPAIQAAREAARRAQCTSNQRQIAVALQNYELPNRGFPPLRAPLRPTAYWTQRFEETGIAEERTVLTWVAFLLPFMEQSTAWSQINSGSVEEPTLYDLVLPVMQCRSSGLPAGDHRINYVGNAGPQNMVIDIAGNDVPNGVEYGRPERRLRDAKMYTVFFDHISVHGPWSDVDPDNIAQNFCDTRITLENIVAMDGTSNTILLSENEDAGHWIWYADYINIPRAIAWVDDSFTAADFYPAGFHNNIESAVAFCYPSYRNLDSNGGSLLGPIPGEIPTYIPLQPGTDTETSPLFINEGRSNSGVNIVNRERTARPSSGHPGGVIAAFCDGRTQFLRDDMDKALFVQLARPGSGVILNPKDLFD